MTSQDSTEHTEAARAAAVAMVAKGLATPSEVAKLAGASRQLVRHWISREGVDWRAARESRLAHEWQKRVK